MTLDADTALEPLTPTRWRGEISDRWWVVQGPFGGYVAAFLARAMLASVGEPARRARSLTIHYVEAPQAGPVEVTATVERAGRSSTTVSLRMDQDGRPVALALGSCAVWRDGEPEWAESAPQVPPPEECERLDGPLPFHQRFEIRLAAPLTDEARNVAWLRLDPPQSLDHVALTAMSDGWRPAAFGKVGRLFAAPTTDLTIHYRAPMATGEWVLADYRTRFSAGGVWEEDGELWAPDGTLIAQSRQLALIRA